MGEAYRSRKAPSPLRPLSGLGKVHHLGACAMQTDLAGLGQGLRVGISSQPPEAADLLAQAQHLARFWT